MKVAPIFFGLMAIAQARIVPSNYFGRVINGKDVEPGEIPYQVSIQMTNSHIHICGGSILNENYVITAAHCIMNHNLHYLEVIAGTTDLNSPQSTHFVDKLIIHENYNRDDTWRNDIGLIKVIEPFVVNFFLNFVSLPSINQTITSDSVAVVSGWGRRKNGELSDVLQKTTTRIASQSYCALVYVPFGLTIRNTHICAYDPHSETGACFGDSGGPLTVNGEIVGIVSWGKECASRYYPIVYTRVSEYIDWIKDNAI